MQHDLVDRYPTHGASYSAGNALSLRQHEEYLRALKPLLEQWRNEGSVIVVGDDNRRIPYAWGPKRTYDLLESALDGYGVATSAMLSGVNEKSIDHVAETLNILTPVAVQPRRLMDGEDQTISAPWRTFIRPD